MDTPTYKVYKRGQLIRDCLTPNEAAHVIAAEFHRDLCHAHQYVRAAQVELAAAIGRSGTIARQS